MCVTPSSTESIFSPPRTHHCSSFIALGFRISTASCVCILAIQVCCLSCNFGTLFGLRPSVHRPHPSESRIAAVFSEVPSLLALSLATLWAALTFTIDPHMHAKPIQPWHLRFSREAGAHPRRSPVRFATFICGFQVLFGIQTSSSPSLT